MPEPRHISAVMHAAFAAVASPRRLDAGKVRVGAWLAINHDAARAGKPQPGGDVLLVIGSDRECDAAIALAKLLPAGGPFGAEYSPVLDAVRVSRLTEIEARGREWLRLGSADTDGWYVVALGAREHCEIEATRLRRIRAGHRSQKVQPV